jgi:hypothetical protein
MKFPPPSIPEKLGQVLKIKQRLLKLYKTSLLWCKCTFKLIKIASLYQKEV